MEKQIHPHLLKCINELLEELKQTYGTNNEEIKPLITLTDKILPQKQNLLLSSELTDDKNLENVSKTQNEINLLQCDELNISLSPLESEINLSTSQIVNNNPSPVIEEYILFENNLNDIPEPQVEKCILPIEENNNSSKDQKVTSDEDNICLLNVKEQINVKNKVQDKQFPIKSIITNVSKETVKNSKHKMNKINKMNKKNDTILEISETPELINDRKIVQKYFERKDIKLVMKYIDLDLVCNEYILTYKKSHNDQKSYIRSRSKIKDMLKTIDGIVFDKQIGYYCYEACFTNIRVGKRMVWTNTKNNIGMHRDNKNYQNECLCFLQNGVL